MLKHQRINGDYDNNFSTYCPKCGHYEVEYKVESSTDFDENGWFRRVMYTCNAQKCKHTWIEKVY